MTVLDYGEGSVSVAMEEVQPDQWMDKVYEPDILGEPKQIYKKQGSRWPRCIHGACSQVHADYNS
jgi:hypothetical protein